jgi:hypothetical protein
MTEWFRSWHGAPTDDKWLVVAKRAGVPAVVVPAVAWALFDHASQAEPRGDVSGFDFETYAMKFGLEEDAVRGIYAAMEAKGIIVDGRLAQWEKRQPRKEDSSSAERQRAARARREQEPSLPLADPPAQASAAKPEPAAPLPSAPAPSSSPPAPDADTLVSHDASAIADEVAQLAGHDLAFVPPSWCGAAARVQVWLARGVTRALILDVARAMMVRKRDGPDPRSPASISYFEAEVFRAHGRANAPVATVVPIARARHGPTSASSITDVVNRYVAAAEGGSGEGRESASRLLPQGGSG